MNPEEFEAQLKWIRNFAAWACLDDSLGERFSVSRADARFLMALWLEASDEQARRVFPGGEVARAHTPTPEAAS